MSRISELASIISENTAIVESFFQARGLPFPSYDINGPSAITIPPNEKASAAHVAVLSATMELHNLMLGPKAVLMSQNVSSYLNVVQVPRPIHTASSVYLDSLCILESVSLGRILHLPRYL